MAKSKHRPQASRSGGNGYLQKKAQEKAERLKRQDTLTQMLLDAVVLADNEIFHRTGDIVAKHCAAVLTALDEISHATLEDAKDDKEFIYAKTKLDERLEKILGKHFQPWDERYRKGE